MKLTSKGQVTIPQEIREEVGFRPGDDLDFAIENGKVTITRNGQAKTRGQRIVEHLWGRATVRMTTDEIMALTRGED
jgi:AbrB family looped-hinge helix DNA binding protein